jgi:tricorn protease
MNPTPRFQLLSLRRPSPRLTSALLTFAWLASIAGPATARSPIRLAEDPALSPDGQTIAFAWRGDLWTVAVTGGVARVLTQHPAVDSSPVFSPDGKQIAFVSDREPGPQVFVMPATGGTPRPLTAHSEGYALDGWAPDGASLLVTVTRDHYSSPRGTQRFFRIPAEPGPAEQL